MSLTKKELLEGLSGNHPKIIDDLRIANAFYMLHKAFEEKMHLYQPPRWDHKPTNEELAAEREYQLEAEESRKRTIELANQIYLTLTGVNPQEIIDSLKEVYGGNCSLHNYSIGLNDVAALLRQLGELDNE
ncbi:MAG: hypothetical protein DWQ19_11360 [Crenarchaeota archaeon]|nr:MAG: hypothetical protein DWQ19_11360 [Thermoproteota archaeon]